MRKWRVIDFGEVDQKCARRTEYTCLKCGNDSELLVIGNPIAQIGEALVFDVGDHAIPKVIECPHCRRRMEAA